MKVIDLMAYLSSCNPNAEVIISKDSEGNNYSPLADIFEGYYERETSFTGEIYPLEWSASDADMSKDEWEDFKDTLPISIVLCPIW